MKQIITAMAYYHLSISNQYNWKRTYKLSYLTYIDVVRLYAMLGIIPGEKEINKILNFNLQIYKEIK